VAQANMHSQQDLHSQTRQMSYLCRAENQHSDKDHSHGTLLTYLTEKCEFQGTAIRSELDQSDVLQNAAALF